MTTVYTVGHGTRSIEEFVEVLRDAGVRRLLDIRRFPSSKRQAHFARDPLGASLRAEGIAYDWRGEELGGRRSGVRPSRHPAWRNSSFQAYADYMDSPAFGQALQHLEADASKELVAIMCAEKLWWRCHRRLVADALTLDGIEVVHLIDVGNRQEHVLHEAVRKDEQGRTTYDVGTTAALEL